MGSDEDGKTSKNLIRLMDSTVKLSRSKDWETAKTEWDLLSTRHYEWVRGMDMLSCECGHHPIKQIVVLQNKFTGNRLQLGVCCAPRFNSDYKRIYDGQALLRKSGMRIPNPEFLKHCFDTGKLNHREFKFLTDIRRKRNLSQKQLDWRTALLKRLAHQQEVP